MNDLAVITGGGRGIGAAVSRRLAVDGYRVLLTYRADARSAEELIVDLRRNGALCAAVKADFGCGEDARLLAEHPWINDGVDVLVLNHGMYERSPAEEQDLDALARTMAVNFDGAVAVWKGLSPNLLIRGAHRRHGEPARHQG